MKTVRLFARLLWRVILPLGIIAAAAVAAKYLLRTTPSATRQRPPERAILVEVTNVVLQSRAVRIEALGSVVPAREITLFPQVSGEIIDVSPAFAPGGLFTNGQRMLNIDPVDYELMLAQRRSALAAAEKDYFVELGEQKMGKYYWELIEESGDTNLLQRQLTLREPQLKSMLAAIEASKAMLRDAELDLERTCIDAPFNALVRNENVDVGKQVSPSTALGTLVGTDAYWVQTAIGVDRIKWLFKDARTPHEEVRVYVRYPNGEAGDTVWPARVRGLLGDLEEAGRMARVLVEIDDPLGLRPENSGRAPLLLGALVEVDFSGRTLENVAVLPRQLLREQDNVWICGPDGGLRIQPVDVVWRELHHVLVGAGLRDSDCIVVSDLSAPVAGMALTHAGLSTHAMHVADRTTPVNSSPSATNNVVRRRAM